MNLSRPILVTAALAFAFLAPASFAKTENFKKVTFDEFFAGSVAPIPLSLDIPSQYSYAEPASNRTTTYSYWMRADEVARAVKTKDLPSKTGYIYGKLTPNETYDRSTGKFMSEDQLEVQIAQAGMELIERKRFEAKGHPVFAYIIKAKNGTVVCSLFVGTLIDTNVLYFGYRPPKNDLKIGRVVWSHILESLK
jgi:hypothetical protein